MTEQLAKREPQEWIEYVLDRFNSHLISEEEACQLLQVKRASFYKVRQRLFRCVISDTDFKLTSSGQNQKRSFNREVEQFLHTELSYIKKEARFYRGKFNFAYLSEKVLGKVGHSTHRSTIQRFAIKEGYYEQTTNMYFTNEGSA